MAQDPELIRRDIEETRRHMGDTVDALAYKADVPGRARDRITGAFGNAKPDAGQVKGGAKQAAGVVQENPLGLAIGAAAVGFLAGMLVPGTRVEDERIGPVADQVKDQARETGQEAVERAQTVAQEAASTAQHTAREQGDELKRSAQQGAQSVRS